MIVDAFMYAGERECLAIRLHELRNVADLVVIVEARETFQGQPRALSFQRDRYVWEPYYSGKRIRYVVIDHFRGCTETWDREAQQRNLMGDSVADLPGDTVCMFSDADEIPRASAVLAYGAGIEHGGRRRLGGPHFHYYANVRQVSYPVWYGTSIVQRASLDLPGYTVQRLRGNSIGNTYQQGDCMSGGWHLAFLGGRERILTKLQSWSHHEDSHFATLSNIDHALATLTDWKQDRGMQLRLVPVDQTWPAYFRDVPSDAARLLYVPPGT